VEARQDWKSGVGQLYADALEVQASDFFVQVLRQAMDPDFVRVAILLPVELRLLKLQANHLNCAR
jgi:hypothetical protein